MGNWVWKRLGSESGKFREFDSDPDGVWHRCVLCHVSKLCHWLSGYGENISHGTFSGKYQGKLMEIHIHKVLGTLPPACPCPRTKQILMNKHVWQYVFPHPVNATSNWTGVAVAAPCENRRTPIIICHATCQNQRYLLFQRSLSFCQDKRCQRCWHLWCHGEMASVYILPFSVHWALAPALLTTRLQLNSQPTLWISKKALVGLAQSISELTALGKFHPILWWVCQQQILMELRCWETEEILGGILPL